MRGLILAIIVSVAACAEEPEAPVCDAEEAEHDACQAYVDATPDPNDGCLLTYITWLRCLADCNDWGCDPRD
jgi:hypothetical protein